MSEALVTNLQKKKKKIEKRYFYLDFLLVNFFVRRRLLNVLGEKVH